MIQSNEAITSIFIDNKINEDLVIYRGRFCIYAGITIRCKGTVYYKIGDPVSINFSGVIYKYEEIKEDLAYIKFDEVSLEIPGYKIIEAEITQINSSNILGFVSDQLIKSKDSLVDYIQFDIVNLDKIPGKLVDYKNIKYAGRIEFRVNEYKIIIDKSFEYNKSLKDELIDTSGNIITHTGRIYRSDGKKFKTKKIDGLLLRISYALSFLSGRYISIPNSYGFCEDKERYRAWYKMKSSNFNFVFNWTSTISNYYNLEKFLYLFCKKTDDPYYYSSIVNILDYYIESISSSNMGNNIISIQTALEMISYVVLVETEMMYKDEEYDLHSSNSNIKTLMKKSGIDYSIPCVEAFSGELREIFLDGVDLITYYRNSVVHPSKSKRKFDFYFDEMWNIILLGISYIELSLLSLINYKGEYTDRFKNSHFGEVCQVPWNKN